MGFSIQCTDDIAPALDYQSIFQVEVTIPNGNQSHDIVYDLSVSPGFHLDRTSTAAFQTAASTWRVACNITADVGALHPELTFTFNDGTFTLRSYADGFRFTQAFIPVPEPGIASLVLLGGVVFSIVGRRSR